jgi:phosphoglycolate phosphatase-like HAD superfamily hydrolase
MKFYDKISAMRKIGQRVLLFDIDGTLLDPKREYELIFKNMLQDVYGVNIQIDHYDMAGKTDWRILTDLLQGAGLEDVEIEAKRTLAFRVYARYIKEYTQNSSMFLLPGIKVLLDQLKADEGFVLGIVSGNTQAIVPYKLRAVGLNPSQFLFGGYGSDHIDRNWLPKIALERFARMQGVPVAADDVLVIGDTPHDIRCARHNGLKVMCVTTGHYDRAALAKHQPDYLLDDLGDTKKVMAIFRSF